VAGVVGTRAGGQSRQRACDTWLSTGSQVAEVVQHARGLTAQPEPAEPLERVEEVRLGGLGATRVRLDHAEARPGERVPSGLVQISPTGTPTDQGRADRNASDRLTSTVDTGLQVVQAISIRSGSAPRSAPRHRETAVEPLGPAHIGGARTVKRLTLREIGRLAGQASPEVKRRVLATIEETGHRPDRAVRSLVSSRTGALGPGEPEQGEERLPGSALRAPDPWHHERHRPNPAHALVVPVEDRREQLDLSPRVIANGMLDRVIVTAPRPTSTA
jgi:hypothetical protein